MAEFTEFMNKRVDHFFVMFKELRSGSISYPEIAKRENVRPPINKVCQKLGVKKVSQMTDDKQLLQAIKSVVYDIEMKRRARAEAADGESAPSTNNPSSSVPQQKIIASAPPGLSKPATVCTASSVVQDPPGRAVSDLKASSTTAQNEISDPDTPSTSENTTAPLRRMEKLPYAPPALQCDPLDLLKVVMAVRSHNGRLQRALEQVQQDPEVSPEVVALTSAYVQSVVKALCALIGCHRLDGAVPHEDALSAFDRYVRQCRDAHGVKAATLPPTVVTAAPAAPVAAKNAPEPTAVAAAPPADGVKAANLTIDTTPAGLERTAQQHAAQAPAATVAALTGPPVTATPRPAASDKTETRPVRPLGEVYAEFWELAYKLFLYVCNPYRHCDECLCVVEDLVNLLDSVPDLRSPLSALALDSIVQRAMYELSDKVSRPLEEGALKRLTNTNGQATGDVVVMPPECSVRNIEHCISLMSRNVSPVCAKIRDEFHQRNHLPAPPAGAAWCEKVLTLTRQLQELIAWSSPHCQARVPMFAPSGKFFEMESTTAMSPTSAAGAAGESKGFDFLSKLTPTAAAELLAALPQKDAVLLEVSHHLSNAAMAAHLPDVETSLQMTLHKLIHQSVAGDCSLSLCGASALGLNDVLGKVKLDFAALSTPHHVNFYDLSPEEQQLELVRQEALTQQLRELERAVEAEKLTEIAWKHLKACARDFHTQSQEYILKLTTAKDGNGGGYGAQGGYGYGANNPYGGVQAPYGQNGTGYWQQYPQGPYGAGAGYTAGPPPELILQIAEDAELMRRMGDGVVEKYQTVRTDRATALPVLAQITQKIEEVQDAIERPERERTNFVRRFCKSLDRALKDQRFLYVRVVSNKVRFTHVNFEQQLSPHATVSCNVIACNPMPIQMTQLLYDYLALDASGKIRDYFQTIKLFVSAHQIADPAGGYLSTTAWYVMALHVLLRYNIVPNIHMHRLYLSASASRPAAVRPELSAAQQEKLSNTPLLVLLDLFFRYYVEQVNIFTSTVTLRHRGTVLPKTRWPTNPVLWRVSVEDPFEPIGSIKPYDLGTTLSRPGQLTTYKALRRAVYGIHTIMAESGTDCRESMKRLFSRVELINLARKSEYMGAVISAPPVWVRPAVASSSGADAFAALMLTAHEHYLTPEGAQQLALVREAGVTSEQSSPTAPAGKRPVPPPAAAAAYTGKAPQQPPFQPTGFNGNSPISSMSRAPRPLSISPPPLDLRSTGAMPAGYAPSYSPQGLTSAPAMSYPSAYAYPTQMPTSPMMPYGGGMYSPQQYPGPVPPPPPMYMGSPHLSQSAQMSPHMQMRSAYGDNRAYGIEYGYQQQQEDPRMQMQQRQMYPAMQAQQPYMQAPQSMHPQQGMPSPQMPRHAVHQQQQQYPAYMPAGQYGAPDSRQQQQPQRAPQQAYPQLSQVPPAPLASPARPHDVGMQNAAQRQMGPGGPVPAQQQHYQQPEPHMRRQVEPLPLSGAMPGSHMSTERSSSSSARTSSEHSARSREHDGYGSSHPSARSREQDGYGSNSSHPSARSVHLEDRYAPARGVESRGVRMEEPYAPSQVAPQRPINTVVGSPRAGEIGGVRKQQPAEARYVPSLNINSNSGSLTARPTEGVRFADEEYYTSGSASARFPSMESRYSHRIDSGASSAAAAFAAERAQNAQQAQTQQQVLQQAPQPVQRAVPRLDLNLRLNDDRQAAAAAAPQRPTLSASLKLDLQPRFAEDRNALSENDPIVEFPVAPNSARGAASVLPISARQSVSATPPNSTSGSGNVSARRNSGSELGGLVSPRDAAFTAVGGPTSRPQKSPVVPLIPLEGISGFSSTSASSSEYGNPLLSDRSSIYMSTARSEGPMDTGRGSLVGTGLPNAANSAAPASSRSTATHAGLQGAFASSAMSMPNTSRTTEFATSGIRETGENTSSGFFSAGVAGLSLSSRVAEEQYEARSGRSPPLTEQNLNLAEAQPTNRLGYMGLEDIRGRRGFPLPTIRSAAASSNGSLPRSNSEIDVLLDRINADPYNGQPLNSARSGYSHGGSSGKGSNASLGLSPDLMDYAHGTMLSPRQMTPRQLTPRREPVLDSIVESAAENIPEVPLSPLSDAMEAPEVPKDSFPTSLPPSMLSASTDVYAGTHGRGSFTSGMGSSASTDLQAMQDKQAYVQLMAGSRTDSVDMRDHME